MDRGGAVIWRALNWLFNHVWPLTRVRLRQDWQDR